MRLRIRSSKKVSRFYGPTDVDNFVLKCDVT